MKYICDDSIERERERCVVTNTDQRPLINSYFICNEYNLTFHS